MVAVSQSQRYCNGRVVALASLIGLADLTHHYATLAEMRLAAQKAWRTGTYSPDPGGNSGSMRCQIRAQSPIRCSMSRSITFGRAPVEPWIPKVLQWSDERNHTSFYGPPPRVS